MTTTNDLDLSPFCAIKGIMRYPWVKDGWRYGCDGAICVRVSTSGEPDSPIPKGHVGPFPNAASLFGDFPICTEPWPAWDGKTKEITCDRCNGSGKASELCPNCTGTGRCTCDCGDVHDCGECDGNGRIRSSMEDCGDCSGTGSIPIPADQRVANRLLDGKYVRAVAALGQVMFCGDGWPTAGLFFATADGMLQGVVMPMKPEE